jgi:hypothetical protein
MLETANIKIMLACFRLKDTLKKVFRDQDIS